MSKNLALTKEVSGLTPVDVLANSGKLLRLQVAEGDASLAAIRTYHTQAMQFVAWYQEQADCTR